MKHTNWKFDETSKDQEIDFLDVAYIHYQGSQQTHNVIQFRI